MTAQKERDDALDAVEAATTDEEWNTCVAAVLSVASHASEFTTDAVMDLMEKNDWDLPREPRLLGAVMLLAARNGWVERTDRMASSDRRTSHAREKRVWKSLKVQA